MRILALGGGGDFGLRAARLLASSDTVTEVTVAGRNLEKAKRAAASIGSKANAASVDVSDHEGLVKLARGSDLLLNTSGPEWEVVPRALRAAIDVGTNYCDLCAHSPTMEGALELDSVARDSGIVALMGMGQNPGLTSLMMAHAARQLDETAKVSFCDFYSAQSLVGWKDRLTKYVERGQPTAAWKMIMKWSTPPFHVFREGNLRLVEDKTEESKLTMPKNGQLQAVEIGGIEHITMPRSFPTIREVHTLVSWFPFQLNDAYRDVGSRIAKKELDETKGTLEFVEALIGEIEKGQVVPEEFLGGYALWAEADGKKNGKEARYACWPASMDWLSTAHALSQGALKVLKGEVKNRGVLTPESCFDPLPFLGDVARSVLKKDDSGDLLHETWHTL